MKTPKEQIIEYVEKRYQKEKDKWEFDIELEEIPELLKNEEPLKIRKCSRNVYFQLSLNNFIKDIEYFINNGGSRNIYNYDLQDSDAIIQYALFGGVLMY